ncbi:MAG: chlorophyll synthesis pathway protein BchC [Pseudomonadota bacterium]
MSSLLHTSAEKSLPDSAVTSLAVVMNAPGSLDLQRIALRQPESDEVLVAVEYSGISTGTERLLWDGTMPNFPGMGYPLVPGYESVGRIVDAGDACRERIGQRVFVSGASCFGEIRGLFGGAASRLLVDQSKALEIQPELDETGTLMALAATAVHAIYCAPDGKPVWPELIIGHGVLGRLLARATIACGGPAPTVWELNADRMTGDEGYLVIQPDSDARRDYQRVFDVSGDSAILDKVMFNLAPLGEVVLAGFYSAPVTFNFAPAFMREARIRIAAQWQPQDLQRVRQLVEDGALKLDQLITHHATPDDAATAYQTAFAEPTCLKMILDWRNLQ